jgi:hypothetical protein
MNPMQKYLVQITAMFCIIGALGCAKHEPGKSTALEHTLDADYSTPESVIMQLAALESTDPIDVGAITALYHAENDLQTRLVHWYRLSASMCELDAALEKRFAESLDPKVPNAWRYEPRGKLTIRKNDGTRAEAAPSDGTDETVHLVKIGDRWWISGYTLEYKPDDDGTFDSLEMLIPYLARRAVPATAIAQRVRNGEFGSAAAARAEFERLVSQKDR